MSTWESAAEAWATSPGPQANPPATWGEIVAANVRQGGLGTFFGAGAMEEQAYRELEEQLHTVTGQDAATFTEQWGGRGAGDPILFTDRAYLIGQKLDKLDKAQREAIAPYVDISGRAAAAAQKASEEDAAVFSRTYGIGGGAVAWATYLGRQLGDPLNLGSAIATGAAGAGASSILGMLGREAIAGAAQSAMVEPLVAAERERLGLPNAPYLEAVAAGALFNVAGAAVLKGAAAGIVGTLRGAAAVGRRLRAHGIEPPIHPDDALAVADAVETQNVLTEQATPPTAKARAAMPPRIDRAGQALEGHGVKAEDPVPGGGADPTPGRARDLERQAATGAEGGAPTAPPVLGPHQVEVGGKRYGVTYKLAELGDLVVSHRMDGQPNPAYPREAQPRNLATPGSRSLVNEAAAHYRVNEALDQSESAALGPAIVTPKQVTMVGNRRLQMLARVYDRHPESAEAYRAGLVARGYDPEGMKFPVLVRELREDLTPAEMQFIGREGNVSPTGKMSAGEQAFSDASLLGDELLALHRSGPVTSLANVPFVRSFVDRLVATTEREAFISKDNVLSVEGVRRVEAALVAKAYEAPDIVAGLFEVTDPSSRAILGALADNAGKAAHVKAEIAAGRIDASLDPSPALVDAFRLVERARKSGQKVDMLAAQVDLETGAVSPDTLDALDYYFRDPPKSKAAKEAGVAYRVAAGRVAIAPQIERAMITSLSKADAAGDLLGFKADAGFALREGGTAEMPPGDLTAGEDLAAPAAEGAAAAAAEPAEGLLPNAPELFEEEGNKGGGAPAEGLPAELQAIVERNKPEVAGPESLRALLERGGTTDELFAHPDVDEALRFAAGMPETAPWVEFRADPYEGAPAGFYENRVYKFPILAKDGKTVTGWREVVGRKAAIAELVKVAKAYAPEGKVAIERKAVIITGPPAAGKSTFAEEIATRLRAAIVDSDDAKKPIPGFKGGAGAEATHAESANLTWAAESIYDRLSADGVNLVIPKIGKTPGQIQELIADLRKLGYDDVRLVNVNVHPDEAARRMIGRFLKTGRIIGGKYFRSIGDGPTKTYYILRGEKVGGKPLVDEAVEIDANGGLKDPRKLIDGADTELGRDLLAGPGGPREQGAPRAAGREGGQGEEVSGPQPSGGARPSGGREPGARGSLPEGAPGQGAGVEPPKPIGDPQLEAEAQSVIADVGEDFQIYLAEPGSDEVRTLSIAQARAEAAEADAAADELLACIAGAAGVTAAAGGAAAGGAAAL